MSLLTQISLTAHLKFTTEQIILAVRRVTREITGAHVVLDDNVVPGFDSPSKEVELLAIVSGDAAPWVFFF